MINCKDTDENCIYSTLHKIRIFIVCGSEYWQIADDGPSQVLLKVEVPESKWTHWGKIGLENENGHHTNHDYGLNSDKIAGMWCLS